MNIELDAEQTRAAEIAYARELWEKDRNAIIDLIESMKRAGVDWPFVRVCLIPLLVADGALTSADNVKEKQPEVTDAIVAMRIPQWMRKG